MAGYPQGAVVGRRAPLARRRASEEAFHLIALLAGISLLVVLGLMVLVLAQLSAPVWHSQGLGLATGADWAPSRNVFGALPFIYGTLVTAAIAVGLAMPVALGAALFVSEVAPPFIRRPVASLLDLLAAVPSVIYGLWGIFVLVPVLRPFQQWLAETFGGLIPIFEGPAFGVGYLTAGVILAIMILPTISAVSREVFFTIPRDQREVALALGATRWETIRTAVLPQARSGITGAVILGLGRALGETIAVTMVIGNSPTISASLLAPGYSMAAVIVNEFSEATQGLHVEALIAIGLLLFAVTLAVNAAARLLIRRTGVRRTGGYR